MHLLYKKLGREFIMLWINLGGVKSQNNLGGRLNNREYNLKTLFIDFGIKKWAINVIIWFLFLKI